MPNIPVSPAIRSVLMHAPIGVLIIDAAGIIVWVNDTLASDFGWAAGTLIGKPMSVLLPERFRAEHFGHVSSYAREPTARMMGSGRDLTGLHSTGREFPVEIALSRVDTADTAMFMAIVSDISGRKRAEDALKATNAQLEEFTYVASHDLRSPLRGIADLITWIREDLGETTLPAEVRHNFDRVALRIQRAEQMIDDLLRYARAGTRDPGNGLVDPHELVAEAIVMAGVPSSFRVEVDIVAAPIETARAPLATSLRNLIANAVKHHGKAEGRIRIELREIGRFWAFHVEDDGNGITPGNEERIFKLFHRASSTTSGDGVGLAITRRMINAHGGMISLSKDGELGGASFEVLWPRIQLKEDLHA